MFVFERTRSVNVSRICVCTEQRRRKNDSVITTNPVYHCEELEADVHVYNTPDNDYIDIIGDETKDQGTKPPLPKPRPETKSQDQDDGYEDLKDAEPSHVYLQLQ